MNILPQLEALKKFIIENTKPPLTTDLLNKLSFITEQAEAHSDDVDRQDSTIAAQIKEIERLMKENAKFVNEDSEASQNAALDKILQSNMLNHDI
jgi:hypothetical protein